MEGEEEVESVCPSLALGRTQLSGTLWPGLKGSGVGAALPALHVSSWLLQGGTHTPEGDICAGLSPCLLWLLTEPAELTGEKTLFSHTSLAAAFLAPPSVDFALES